MSDDRDAHALALVLRSVKVIAKRRSVGDDETGNASERKSADEEKKKNESGRKPKSSNASIGQDH